MGALVLSVQTATNWVVAGHIADDVVRDAVRMGPQQGELLLLSVPANYRSAHVLGVGVDAAVELSGLNRRTAWCSRWSASAGSGSGCSRR